MGAIDSLFHLSLFLGLVFTLFICFRIFCIQYGGESFWLQFRELSSSSSGSSAGTRGPFSLLREQEGGRVTDQGRILGAAEPVKLDLDLGDFPEPGVRQLWGKQGFYWEPV